MNPTDALYTVVPIGMLRSLMTSIDAAPRQGAEGAPDAWVDLDAAYLPALSGVSPGDELLVITWLHLADRSILQTHPRNDPRNPIAGVFATRSPHRPNPLGLHRVVVKQISGTKLLVGPIEAVDGTPVVDIKPVLHDDVDRHCRSNICPGCG